MKRRILSVLLAAALMIGLIPAVAAAPSGSDTPTQQATVDAATDPAPTAAPETSAPATEAPEKAPTRSVKQLAPTAAAKYPEITSISPAATGLKLKWSSFTGAAKYFIFLKSSGKWKKIGEASSTSCLHKNLKNNATYTYTIRAVNKAGKFISSAYTKGWSSKWFQVPQLIKCESVNGGQKLSWKAVKGAEVYRVFIKSGSKWIAAGNTDTTYCTNSRVTSGKKYTYTVRCWDADASAPLSYFDTKGCSGTYIAAPKITSFSAVQGGVTITWDKVQGAKYYAVFRKLAKGWKQLYTTTKMFFTDIGIRTSARYTYTVRCVDAQGHPISGYNKTGWSFTHLAPPKLTSVTYRDQSYTIKWKAQTTASYYRVYRKERGGKWAYLGKATKNTFTDTTATKEGVYSYAVRTMDEKGNFLTYYDDYGNYYCMGINVIGMIATDTAPPKAKYTTAVTENELRRLVATVANGYLETNEGDEYHTTLLSFYNSYTPLAANHQVQKTDPWSAVFASSVWIRAGLAPYICADYTELRMIDAAKSNHIWVESDSYLPKVGDAIVYNWSDTGIGECSTGADHMGIVTAVSGSDFTVVEGDTGTGYVGSHERVVNAQYIRGFITPNYKQIARYLTLKAQHI